MRKITHERAMFLERTYAELRLYFECYEVIYSRPCIRLIKLIVKHLLHELYLYENERINSLSKAGKLTPKEAVRLRAKNKKTYLCHFVKMED